VTISSSSKYSGVKAVDDRLRFDELALASWLGGNVQGYSGPLTVSQFNGGQSNPTYRLDTHGASYVLRRRPPGTLLPSAHAVDREFKVISALYPQEFPVARPYGYCADEQVIGTPFFVMEMVDGRVCWDAALPDNTPEMRGSMFRSAVQTLARLHNFDPTAIGLADYGKPGNYFARQVDRWSRQYRASETTPKPAMDKLIAWLPQTVPAQERSSVVHGDYRLDNMIFDKTNSKILAVLDWELSTLGDPLADFTYYLMHWYMPVDGRSGMVGLDIKRLGIPSADEIVEQYCGLTGRSSVPDFNWYFAYNLFRLAAIVQGIAGRMRDGTAANTRAAESAARAEPLANRAWEFALKAGA
jgi:aminoglycoside phosphotransferase (APT) family kinase protein